jgi:hypothetical protein
MGSKPGPGLLALPPQPERVVAEDSGAAVARPSQLELRQLPMPHAALIEAYASRAAAVEVGVGCDELGRLSESHVLNLRSWATRGRRDLR